MSKFVLIDLHPIPYDVISKEDAEKQGCIIDEITSKLVSDYPEYNEGIIFEYKDNPKMWVPIKLINGVPWIPVPKDTCTVGHKILSRNDDEVVVKILFNKVNNE